MSDSAARDFYYEVLAPEENGLNYQRLFQSDIYSGRADESSMKIFGHAPIHSNDYLIERYIEETFAYAHPLVRQRLEAVFVAKRRNFFANAAAVHALQQYSGDLVLFHVGLSDAFFQYSTVFAEYLTMRRLRTQHHLQSAEVREIAVSLNTNLNKLAIAQVDWGILENEIRFREETVVVATKVVEDMAAAIACLMDKHVLHHELSHHFLGHTGQTSQVTELLRELLAPHLPTAQHLTDEHRREIEADLAALLLPISNGAADVPEEDALDLALGALLAQTVMAQLKSSIHLEAVSHPSWATRHQIVLSALKSIHGGELLGDLIDDVERFQTLLYHSQSRGLGRLCDRLADLGPSEDR